MYILNHFNTKISLKNKSYSKAIHLKIIFIMSSFFPYYAALLRLSVQNGLKLSYIELISI